MKFGTVGGLHLFSEFRELWSGGPAIPCATCISPSLMHLFIYLFNLFIHVQLRLYAQTFRYRNVDKIIVFGANGKGG